MDNIIEAGTPEISALAYWENVAVKAFEQFERERKAAIEKVISQAPAETQGLLLQIQLGIDTERSQASTALSGRIIGTDTSDPKLFAYWEDLAVKAPDRFERERRAAIGGIISRAPKETRESLLQIQLSVDIERSWDGFSHTIGTDTSDFNFFEYWSKLAAEDSERFEREKKGAIERVIDQATERNQERLRQLHWRIDMECARAGNPLAACIRSSKMMWDFVYADNGFVNSLSLFKEELSPGVHLVGEITEVPGTNAPLPNEAKVLLFKKKDE